MTQIIFLDMDGVLCTNKAHIAQGSPNDFHGFMEALDREAIGLLNVLHSHPKYPDTYYVLSSTWRKMHDRETMEGHLRKYGWMGVFHDDWKTPELQGIRGEEIEDWLSRNHCDSYVILDDNSDMTETQIVNHFVHTDTYDGMGFRNFCSAERILYDRDSRY